MYAGVACGCCMGNMVVVLEHTPIPTLSPYFFHQFIPTFYLIFSKFFNVLGYECTVSAAMKSKLP